MFQFKRISILWTAAFILSIPAFSIGQALPYQRPERSAEQRVDVMGAERCGVPNMGNSMHEMSAIEFCIFERRTGKVIEKDDGTLGNR